MKKIIITLTTILMLTGCAAGNSTPTETSTNETTKPTTVTVDVETGTTAATDAATADTTEKQPPMTETTEPTAAPDSESTDAERAALNKLNEKYGREFKVVSRNLCWESWGGEQKTDPSEPLSVYYHMRDSEGSEFGAYIKENTDIITYDSYLYVIHKKQFEQEIGEVMNRLLPGGKVNIENVKKIELPFECSADMSYEEFRKTFIDNGGSLWLNIFVTDGIEVPEDIRKFRTEGYLEELGCPCRIIIYNSPQGYYDSLENVFTEHMINIDGTIIN